MYLPNSILRVLVFIAITLSLPFYFTLWGVCYLYYQLIILCSNVLSKGLVYPVQGVSTFFTPDKINDRPNSVLVHVAVLEGVPDRQTVLSHLEKLYNCRTGSGSRMYDKLGYSCEYWLGYRFWKRIPNFRISDQVHFISDREVNASNIGDFVGEIIRKPFKIGKPLWEIYVFLKSNEGDGNYIVFRNHHILLDGMSLVKLWYKGDGGGTLPSDLIKYSTTLPGRKQRVWNRYWMAIKSITVAQYLSNRILLAPDDRNCVTNEYKDYSGDWYCSPVKKIRLDKYRGHLRALKFSITHVILVAYARGFKRFLDRHYGADQVPKSMTICGSIPRPGHPDDTLTNHWAIIQYQTKLKIEDLKEQLVNAKAEYTSQVRSIVPETFEFMIGLASCLPGPVAKAALKIRKSGTLSLSNIPGHTDTQTLFNRPVSDRAIWLPLTRENCGIGMLFLTYNGWGNFTMTADSGCIQSRESFNDLHEMVLEELTFVLDQVVKMSNSQELQPVSLLGVTVL